MLILATFMIFPQIFFSKNLQTANIFLYLCIPNSKEKGPKSYVNRKLTIKFLSNS